MPTSNAYAGPLDKRVQCQRLRTACLASRVVPLWYSGTQLAGLQEGTSGPDGSITQLRRHEQRRDRHAGRRSAFMCLLFRAFFRLVDQLLQGRVDRFLSGAADPFVTDDSLAIEDIVGRRAGVPSRRDRLT